MRISVLCSDRNHPIYPQLSEWSNRRRAQHAVELEQRKADLRGGDILFLISCHELIGSDTRSLYQATLVIHASDLPTGRGWSPHIWQILSGSNEIPVTLLEAEDRVDSGAIWAQRIMRLEGHELCDEINDVLFRIELELMDYAISHFGEITPRPQEDRDPTYFPRRTPADSKLDVRQPLCDQFDLLRIADAERFPAYFDYRGHRYIIRLTRADDYAPEK